MREHRLAAHCRSAVLMKQRCGVGEVLAVVSVCAAAPAARAAAAAATGEALAAARRRQVVLY